MVLRKYLSGARLRKIEQFGFERIVDFTFEKKTGVFHLVVELFSKGNMILTDEDYIIKYTLVSKKWKDRTIRGNVKYEIPLRTNPLAVSEDEFNEIISKSEKESIVKTLALDFGLGGAYAEELCARAGVDKEEKEAGRETGALYKELLKLRKEKLSPNIGRSIHPIAFVTDPAAEEFEAFNQALDSVLTKEEMDKVQEKRDAPYKKEVNRFLKQISDQEQMIEKLKAEAVANQEKGEQIYNNYSFYDNLLKDLKKIVKEHPQKEIKKKLKGHKYIKEINFKDMTVTIEK
jgi:predicted ribosome quality control (RQC) complex YloA/Tae2 family protein